MKGMMFMFNIYAAVYTAFLPLKYCRRHLACVFLTFIAFTLIACSKQQAAPQPVETKTNFNPVQVKQEVQPKITIKDHVLIDAPVINQLPELPRGCEVTSLAMLLEHAGIQTDKMKLAKDIKKDPARRIIKNGKVHFGNPHNGFVGDMYSFNAPGLGVYHEPIQELGEKYMPGKIVNLTGKPFEELKTPLSGERPVWVIINAEYRELPDSYFQTWETSSGPVKITMKEHSVLITGYDDRHVYFNDPLTGTKNKKAPIGDFEKSWVQMGSQALTYK
ncbi:hypothetical protein D4T97_006820 [Siminovitchia acidinfaciens]|uniref:Peptidase C39-like domain-containing protein n=2 Tax=Siminovitchia acidinfaciens TaxID=2321395 RepID=A0A429Y521_9BACI|nr:hypothetical protein D4T97_006820 [Siminovitchia acidinfaciens]